MTKNLFIDIIARDKSKRALTAVQTKLGEVRNRVFSLRSAFLGLGAGLVVRSFVNVGKEVESLNIRFKFLFGSAEEGAKAFDNLAKFAGTVPFSLEEISRASGNLAVVAKDADDLKRVLEITGNVAAVTGLDFETTSSQIQRAFAGGIGAADLFRERGVRALLGFEAGAKVTAEETVKRFEELFSGNGRFAGATRDLATTLEGTISMLGDKFFNLQKDVAEGFFDELKKEFGDLNQFLEQNEEQIEAIATSIGKNFAGALQKTSETVKALAPSVKTVADAIGTTIDGFKSLPSFVQTAGIVSVLLFGKKGALAIGSISFLLGQIDDLIEKTEKKQGQELLLDFDLEQLRGAIPDLESVRENIRLIEERFKQSNSENRKYNARFVELRDLLFQLEERYLELGETVRFATKVGIEFGQAFENAGTKIERTDERIKEITRSTNRAIGLGTSIGEEYEKAFESIGQNTDTITEAKFPRFQRVLEEAGDTTRQLDIVFSNTFNNFADTLADTLMTGKFAFKDFARSVIRDIARMIARQQALLFYQRAFNFLGGSIFGVSLPAPPPAQNGRPAFAGQPLMVGETGKEMFVPQQNGYIVPNNQMSGSGVTNINFTINTVDATGVDELLTNRRSTIINVINDALNRQGKEALV